MTDASDNGTSRLDRIGAALETVATTMQSMATNTAIGFEMLTNMTRVLDARMVVLDAQMATRLSFAGVEPECRCRGELAGEDHQMSLRSGRRLHL